MKKGKSIALISVISVILAVWLFLTFARFSVGINNYNSVIGAIGLDYDVNGGLTYELTYDKENESSEVEDVDSVIKTLSARLDILGYKAYEIQAYRDATKDVKDYSIRINLKNNDLSSTSSETRTDVLAVAAYGTLSFYGGTEENPTTEILTDGKVVDSAKFFGQNGDGYVTEINLTDYGFDTLKALVGDSSIYYLRIALGDEDILNSSLSADGFTNKTLYITANTEARARQIAMQISTGGLEYRYIVSEDKVESVSPYGKSADLYLGLVIATLFIVLIAAMLAVFGGFGVIGTLSMIFFGLLESTLMIAIPGIYLSAAGFIGIGVATILTADGLFITIKRIREEFANGKTVKASVKTGYKRAFMPVLGTNLITGFAALMLYAFSGGALVSFAITLAVGAVVSFLASALVSRMFTAILLPLVSDKEKFLNLKRDAENQNKTTGEEIA
ncbi:MAG: hypothetical protein SPL13_05130 [Clostridia bacterium]|nr:hypothetical protein [Clostridia bacterium]